MQAICPNCSSNEISVTVEVLAIFEDGEVRHTQRIYEASDGVLSCDTCCETSFATGKQAWIDAAINKYESTYARSAA
jgi:hypothetical protein